ncbi:CDP-glycerol glycerophosphotransferase family protein [Tetragenococcus koreensis]|uniref:glycosyltransferase n=1 Tax=Tetragenococcus koreensis TaxID=290335 RepID=UPI001F3C95C4|nr:glycosyltransferase [Tetragenococcus koreensis]MCF1619444.1 CDP-glycerol glycerophosphotransferase family protein [Tetragenococcus koreensis]MCF1656926.1 CDP-glycerol glycerophosphotransferase family protein [Tetragenococcus koreensis]
MPDVKKIIRSYRKKMGNINFSRQVEYQKAFKKYDVKNNIILYESFHGKGMTDNPFAIFKYLLNNPNYKNMKHIWVLNDYENNEYYNYYKKFANVEFVKTHTKKYFCYLVSAKYLINSVSFPPYFVKKEEQVYVNTWHGTPLKTLGKDMEGSITQHSNLQRNFLQTDYILSPNEFTSEKIVYSHDINDIYTGKVLENGYPRIDNIFYESQVLESNFPILKGNKKLVLYAPTWRGEVGKVDDIVFQIVQSITDIVENINIDEYEFLVKVHPLVYKYIEGMEFEEITLIPNWADTDELLHYVDVLVTDYSSIFFDFLVTDKPIIFYLYDKDEYLASRGVYLDLDNLPGSICYTTEDVSKSITESDTLANRYEEQIESYKGQFINYDNGSVTKDYIDRIFLAETNIVEKDYNNQKPNVVMYAGAFLNNGVTSSVINLSKLFPYDKYNLIIIDKSRGNKTFEDNIKRLSPNVHMAYRGGGMNLTFYEWVRYNRFMNYSKVENVGFYEEIVQQEWKRLLGDINIEVGIDFSGYVPFWTFMMAFSGFSNRIIYQHNDMAAEKLKVVNDKKVHFKNLTRIFSLYKFFDFIASVGEKTLELNKTNLAEYSEEKQFIYIPNVLDPGSLFKHRKESSLEKFKMFNEDMLLINDQREHGRVRATAITAPTVNGKNFINIGRLSPEKDQEKLLQAFALLLREEGPIHQLYLVGSGELEKTLKAETISLGIEDNVIFTGQTNKAIELLDKCDCFLLSSNHEGQPMTLLEAIALNKPVIATNIEGNRSVLGDNSQYGDIVENSVDGLLNGMKKFLSGEMKSSHDFDIQKYDNYAMEEFTKMIDHRD